MLSEDEPIQNGHATACPFCIDPFAFSGLICSMPHGNDQLHIVTYLYSYVTRTANKIRDDIVTSTARSTPSLASNRKRYTLYCIGCEQQRDATIKLYVSLALSQTVVRQQSALCNTLLLVFVVCLLIPKCRIAVHRYADVEIGGMIYAISTSRTY